MNLYLVVQVSAACPFKSHKVFETYTVPPAVPEHTPADVQAVELSTVLGTANALELNKNRTRNKRVFKIFFMLKYND